MHKFVKKEECKIKGRGFEFVTPISTLFDIFYFFVKCVCVHARVYISIFYFLLYHGIFYLFICECICILVINEYIDIRIKYIVFYKKIEKSN